MSIVLNMPDAQFERLRPAAATDALIRHYDDDILAWSAHSARPTALKGVAAVVFQILDGSATVSELISDIHDVVGVPAGVARGQLRRVIDELSDAGLLDGSAAAEPAPTKFDLFPAPPNP